MWQESTFDEKKRERRRSQQYKTRQYSQIQLTDTLGNGQEWKNRAHQQYPQDNIPDKEKKEPPKNKQLNRSFTTQQMDKEAAKQMVHTIKVAESRMTEMKKQCHPNCTCHSCETLNFTRKVCLNNNRQILWSGTLITHPNTDKYRLLKATLTYQYFLSIPIGKEILKVKYLIDKELYVPIIKITHGGPQQTEARLLANRKESVSLMVHLVLAIVAVNQKLWTKFASNDCAEGLVYKRYSMNGEWQRIHLQIHKGTLTQKIKDESEEQFQLKTPCLWTAFKIIERQLPHIVIKLWNGIWKVEYGLPVNKLAEWLSAFLSLVRLE